MTSQNTLDLFEYNGKKIRTGGSFESPVFVAHDVAEVLGYTNKPHAYRMLDEDEMGIQIVDTLGGPQEMICINESGLYTLILNSRKPEAKAFKKWVTNEVLPSIRRKGYYGSMEAIRRMIRIEIAKDRLNQFLYNSDIFDEDKLKRFIEIDKMLYNREMSAIFSCSKSTIKEVRKMIRNARGDFSDERPASLKPEPINDYDFIDSLKRMPASEAMKQDIYEMYEHREHTFEQISDRTGYSIEWCRRIYNNQKLKINSAINGKLGVSES